MKKIRLYQNTALTVGKSVELSKDNSHHLNKVLRFPGGKRYHLYLTVTVFDYNAMVQKARKK